MLKILYISHSHASDEKLLLNVGGMQRVSLQLVRALAHRDDVELRAEVITGKWEFIAYKTAAFLLKNLIKLPRIVREFKPDVVVFSSMVTAGLAVPLRESLAVPLVSINHGQDVTLKNPIYQAWVKKVLSHLDATFSVSTATREQTVNRGMPPKNAYVLPNGYVPQPLPKSNKQEARDAINEMFGISQEKSLLLTTGRLVRRKGHAWFLENVLPHIKNVHYLVLGDGEQMKTVKKIVAEKNLENKVLLAGRVEDHVLQLAYQAADLFIMPNIPVKGDMEGFGIVLLEANAAGTFVVGSRLEGIQDVIESGENGFLLSPESAEEYISVIEDLLQRDCNKLGKQASNFVSNKFTWDAVAAQYVHALEKVVHSKK